MKTFQKILFLLIILSLSFSQLHAAVISSIQSGDWLSTTTWDLGRVPTDGDYVIINYGHTVSLYKPLALNDLYVEVNGDLVLDNTGTSANRHGSLSLNVNSVVVVLDNASISATTTSDRNYIVIYNTDDVHDINNWIDMFVDVVVNGTEWTAADGVSLDGPLYIDDNATSDGLVSGSLPTGFTPLPIKLLSFEAHVSSSGVNISWVTATEENNHYFVIQRSTDASNYVNIASVSGAGNSVVELSYNYFDATAPTGVVYYRLKQVDIDGKSETFDPVAVSISSSFESMSQPEMELFPNPIQNGDLHLSLNNWDYSNETILTVFSITGSVVYQESVSNSFGNELLITEDIIGSLKNGTYLLVCSNSQDRITKQFIVQ